MKFTELGIVLIFCVFSANCACQTEWSSVYRPRNYPNTRIEQQQQQQNQQNQQQKRHLSQQQQQQQQQIQQQQQLQQRQVPQEQQQNQQQLQQQQQQRQVSQQQQQLQQNKQQQQVPQKQQLQQQQSQQHQNPQLQQRHVTQQQQQLQQQQQEQRQVPQQQQVRPNQSQITTKVEQKIQNNLETAKSEIKKREQQPDFSQFLKIFEQLQNQQQKKNSQINPEVAETQSDYVVQNPSEINERSSQNKNYGWNPGQNQNTDDSTIDITVFNPPSTPDNNDFGDYGPGTKCILQTSSTNPKKSYYNCSVGLNPASITIKKTHDLWFNPHIVEGDIDIKVPNYKITEFINAYFKDSPVKQNVNVWVKKPEIGTEVATQKPTFKPEVDVQVNYEKFTGSPRIHYADSHIPGQYPDRAIYSRSSPTGNPPENYSRN